MIPVILIVAAGALAVVAVSGKGGSRSSNSLEGEAADAALDGIIDTGIAKAYLNLDAVSQPISKKFYTGAGSRPEVRKMPKRGDQVTRSGPKRTQAQSLGHKRIIESLPRVKKVNWNLELKGRRGSSKTSRLDHPPCKTISDVTVMVDRQVSFIKENRKNIIITKVELKNLNRS